MSKGHRRWRLPLLLLGVLVPLLGGFALWHSDLFRQCGFFDRTFETSGCVARLTPAGWHPPALGGAVWPTPEALVLFDNVGGDLGSDAPDSATAADDDAPDRRVDLVRVDPTTGQTIDRIGLPIVAAEAVVFSPDGTEALLSTMAQVPSTPAGGNHIGVSTIDGSVVATTSDVTPVADRSLVGAAPYRTRYVPGTDDLMVGFNEGLRLPLALFDRTTGARIRDFGDETFGYGDGANPSDQHLFFAVSAGGDRLAAVHTDPPRSEGVDAVIRVWRIADGVELATFQIPETFRTHERSLFLSPDGTFVGVTTTGPDTQWPILGAGASHGVTMFRVPETR